MRSPSAVRTRTFTASPTARSPSVVRASVSGTTSNAISSPAIAIARETDAVDRHRILGSGRSRSTPSQRTASVSPPPGLHSSRDATAIGDQSAEHRPETTRSGPTLSTRSNSRRLPARRAPESTQRRAPLKNCGEIAQVDAIDQRRCEQARRKLGPPSHNTLQMPRSRNARNAARRSSERSPCEPAVTIFATPSSAACRARAAGGTSTIVRA